MRTQPPQIQLALITEILHNFTNRYTAITTNLDLAEPGYPTQTIGASPPQTGPTQDCKHPNCNQTRPCPTHDPEPVDLTPVEHYAQQPNPAPATHKAITTHLHRIINDALALDKISHQWGNIAPPPQYCSNCTQYGEREPRLRDRSECAYCRDFRLEHHQPPNQAIFNTRNARNGHLPKQAAREILAGTRQRA